EIIITQDDVINSKPAPDLFLLAAEKMKVNPHKCLVFEDSLLGIEAAKNAGMESLLVTPKDPQ
ncbi:MAG: HAD family hydrolase, partial [Verrucomicrobiales bacterium]|nr:HAD family hydrolase [Verrucomicrobiales bacterium]